MSRDERKRQGVDLPANGRRYLPHRPPMCFVDTLLERFGDKAVGSCVMPESGLCFDNQDIFPEFLIEVVAQTVAMANGYDAAHAGEEMREGMLVGVDAFRLCGSVSPGDELRIVTEKTFEFGAVKIIHGEVYCDGRVVAEGDIKVWEDLS